MPWLTGALIAKKNNIRNYLKKNGNYVSCMLKYSLHYTCVIVQ